MEDRTRLPVFFTAMLLIASPVHAADLALPGVNTGATSFEDGGGGIGHFFQTSNSRFDANRSYDASGEKRPINYDRALWIARLHYAYTAYLGGRGPDIAASIRQVALGY